MAEYIERENVLSELEELLVNIDKFCDDPYYSTGINEGLTDAISVIKKVSAADVHPERHGCWIERRGYNIPLDVYEVSYNCNCCGGAVYKKYSFCPNCGAKMGGRENR